jgi:hypothetical protein
VTHAAERAAPKADEDAAVAKVPAAHTEHTRSAVAEAGAVYEEPGAHVDVCGLHPVEMGSADVDDVAEAEKVPAAHGLQTRSLKGVEAAE